MLTFTNTDNKTVYINPAHVVSVTEGSKVVLPGASLLSGGVQTIPVVIVTTVNNDRHKLLDPNNTVACQIHEAKK